MYYHSFRHIQFDETNCTIGVNHQRNRQPTNREKCWQGRYAGCLVLDGTGTYKDWHGEIHHVRPGSFVHHHPGKFHHIERPVEGWEETCLILGERLYSHFVDLGWLDTHSAVDQISRSTHLIHLFKELHEAISSPQPLRDSQLILKAAALANRIRELAEETELPSREEIVIAEAKAQLAADLTCKLDLEEVSVATGFSYPHFRKLFREMAGVPPGVYRNRKRLGQARLMLVYSELSVAEIADRLGYADQFCFSKQFKQSFGIAPKAYSLKQQDHEW